MSNDNLSPSLAPVLKAIPYESIGKPGRRASEIDRDRAAIELAAYVIGVLKFDHGAIDSEQLLKRANKVRVSQGFGVVVFVNETADAIRASAEPTPSATAFEATEARMTLLMQEPAE